MIAIMQPTFLPWVGYFDLADAVEKFVFLDQVQFSRQSWQQRNRIVTPQGLMWLTVPVRREGLFGPIRDVAIAGDAGAGEKILRSIEQNYRPAPHFEQHFDAFAAVFREAWQSDSLLHLNVSIIRWLARQMGFSSTWMIGSDLGLEGRRSDLVSRMCQAVGAREYLSPLGSLEYLLAERSYFDEAGIRVLIQHYEHPVYPQLHQPFQAHASALDLLFNCGAQSAAIVRGGRREPWSLENAPHADTPDS